MFTPLTVILSICLYMALLFGIAQWAEKHRDDPRPHPLVYALSIAIFFTAWSYYGSVGLAANSGLIYLAIHLGAVLAIVLWWIVLRRIVYLKETFHITSIADFISARYNRSQKVAALVTLIALIGSIPYIALQLKAVVATYGAITAQPSQHLDWNGAGLLVTVLMAAFTILFGVRRLDPTERHPGVMFALAAESLIKLAVFLVVGLFIVYGLFDGFQDIMTQAAQLDGNPLTRIAPAESQPYIRWTTILLLGMFGIQFLPRQFHVCVVENADVRHIRTAMWLIPLYCLLIDLFVAPIAAAGRLSGLPLDAADMYVLLLPLNSHQPELTLLTFIGGFSAASSMIIISAMTLSTMLTNHLLVPVLESSRWLQPLRHYLLQCRWLAVLLVMACSYGFARLASESFLLVSLGILSFAAIAQFAPAVIAALFWRGGSAIGALLGLGSGFAVWFYTLIVPIIIDQGGLPATLLSEGPWQLSWLRPEALFGVDMLPPVTHSLFWSLLINTGIFMLVSLWWAPERNERVLTNEFMQALEAATPRKAKPKGLRDYIELAPKIDEAQELLSRYLPPTKAKQALTTIVDDLLVEDKSHISIMELVEFHRMLERILSGSIGAAAAHRAIETSIKYSEREAADLQAIYSDILSELLTTPQELSQQADFLTAEAGHRADELEAKVREREAQIRALQEQLQQQQQELHQQLRHERERAHKIMRLLKNEIRRHRMKKSSL